MIFNPWAKIKELEEELDMLRQGNENIKKSRDEWRKKCKATRRCLNTARDILEEVSNAVEDAGEVTDVDIEMEKDPIDKYSTLMNMPVWSLQQHMTEVDLPVGIDDLTGQGRR